MKPKFKIGDEVFFMGYQEPQKQKVKGVAIITGEFKNTSFEISGTAENQAIVYSTGGYNTVDETKCFATKEELQTSLFAKLEETN